MGQGCQNLDRNKPDGQQIEQTSRNFNLYQLTVHFGSSNPRFCLSCGQSGPVNALSDNVAEIAVELLIQR